MRAAVNESVLNDPADPWVSWRARRPAITGVHLDSAAAGRSSQLVLQATADHARLEAQVGGYVAEAAAAPLLATGRASIAAVLGIEAGGVAFVESASAARAALLAAWPLPPRARIGVAPSKWGPNLEAFERSKLEIVVLDVDDKGIVDLDALHQLLAESPPDVVHLTHVASHRSLVQPVAEVALICRSVGVPLWVDAAQALGHVDTATGADATYATSRKWLAGPRGVGVLGARAQWCAQLRTPRSAMLPPDGPPVARLESLEAHVAGRVGLCCAVEEYLRLGPENVWLRLAEVGDMTREAMRSTPGWEVVGPVGGRSAITALRPTAGQDVTSTRQRLLVEHGIVTTAALTARAPLEMTEDTLRISPHVDCTLDDLERVQDALCARTRAVEK